MSVTINSAAYGITGAFTSIFSAIVLFIPLFLIPYSFRIAGGLLGRFHEFATTSRKRMHQGILGDARDEFSLRNQAKNRLSAQYTAAESRAIDSTKTPLAADANIGQRARRRLQNSRAGLINTFDGRVNERQSRHQKRANDMADMISSTGNDDDIYAAGWFSVASGAQIPEGLSGENGAIAPGINTGPEMFFDSKGRQKGKQYLQSQGRKSNRNQREAGAALEYPVRKIQTDKDVGNWRRSFEASALRQNWDKSEMNGVLAASAFKHKDKFPELFYEKPRFETDANGNRSVEWDDSSNVDGPGLTTDQKKHNLKARDGIAGELHRTKQSFQLGTVRDGQLRSWNNERTRIQNAFHSNQPVSDDDARFYAQTNEILDSLVSRNVITREGDAGPEMTSTGASPAAQGVIKSLVQNRKYELNSVNSGNTVAGANESSVNNRAFYNRDTVQASIDASAPIIPATGKRGNPTLSRESAINANLVKEPIGPNAGSVRTIDVTGDAERSQART
jgi:hypothetical protein